MATLIWNMKFFIVYLSFTLAKGDTSSLPCQNDKDPLQALQGLNLMTSVIQNCQQLVKSHGNQIDVHLELEKMRKILISELNAAQRAYENELETIKSAFQAETTALKDLVSEIQTNMSCFRKEQESAQRPRVSFSAYRTTDFVTASLGQIIIFQAVRTNDGGGYDNQTGIFTVPVNGVYYFFASLLATRPGEFKISVSGNSKIQPILMLTDRAGFDQVSNSVIVNLKAGDKVRVQTNWRRRGDFSIYRLWSTFSGMLIHHN